jgi:hypothetical protein
LSIAGHPPARLGVALSFLFDDAAEDKRVRLNRE